MRNRAISTFNGLKAWYPNPSILQFFSHSLKTKDRNICLRSDNTKYNFSFEMRSRKYISTFREIVQTHHGKENFIINFLSTVVLTVLFISTLNFVFDIWCCSIEMISSLKMTQIFPIRIISVQSFCLGVTPTCDGFLFKRTSINNQSNSGKTRFESWMDDFFGKNHKV